MASTVFYLVRNPAALKKVVEEIRSKFSSVDEIVQGPKLNELTYLRACIDEAMRLSPSVGGLLPREVLPGGIIIDGESIPQGVVIGTPHYAIHHNEAYYPNPYAYVPERWLAGSANAATGQSTSQEDVEVAGSAFCPFSIGPRGCIGKELAYVEMRTSLARTLFLYDMRRAVGVVDPGEGREGREFGRHRVGEFQLVDTFTSIKDGPMVEFRRRDG
jgi:cytochrome P450